MNINLTKRCLESKHGETRFLLAPKQLKKKSAVKLAKSCLIAPNTVMFVKAKAADCDLVSDCTYSGYVEPKV